MTTMNPYLAAMYNTHGYGTQVQQERTKIAAADIFCKAAAAEGIDLSTLTNEVRQQLFEEFCTKLAEEEGAPAEGEEKKAPPFPPVASEKKDGEDEGSEKDKKEDEKEEEEKESAARAEFLAKQEWMQKQAEADFLGRQMAHAFMSEKTAIEMEKEGKALPSPKGKPAAPKKGAIGGKKQASALDQQAATAAVKIAESYGYPINEVTSRLQAVLTLGAKESEKIAHAKGDYNAAIGLRGLELLEQAGYPIAWEEVLGQ